MGRSAPRNGGNSLKNKVPPARFELAAPGLGKRLNGGHQGLKIPHIFLNLKKNLGNFVFT